MAHLIKLELKKIWDCSKYNFYVCRNPFQHTVHYCIFVG